ncbi:WD-repeat protein [Sarcoptes scabiei]|nr:WD-repeat protein [Sarcoptes scabiei]
MDFPILMEQSKHSTEESDQDDWISEGKIRIPRSKSVFYNNVQEFNRDLSVLSVHTYLKHEYWRSTSSSFDQLSIFDALSATGLRSIRYSKECLQCSLPLKIIANDLSEKSVSIIKKNITLNGVKNVDVYNEDCSIFMYKRKALNQRLNVIDLDPYGSPIQFLDAAIQTIEDGGLLMITSTDMAVLCGNQPGACYAKYASYPIRAKFCHEMALRILIAATNSHATRYGRYIKPLLSLSIDFYIRIFVQVFSSKNHANKSIENLSYLLTCKECESFTLQPLCTSRKENDQTSVLLTNICTLCGGSLRIGGPIWSSSIHDSNFVQKMQNELKTFQELSANHFRTFRRMEGLLQMIDEELQDCPLYYQLDRLCSLVRCTMPPIRLFRSILINGGYRVSYSHALKNSIKTDAPKEFIWSILQFLIGSDSSNPKIKPSISKIIEKKFSYTIKDELVEEKLLSKSMNLLRYQINPEVNWGPKSRPNNDDQNEKRIRNQDKHVKKRQKIHENALKTI